MKIIQTLLLISFLWLVNLSPISGQRSASALRLGIGANSLLSINNIKPFQTGLGTEFQLWLEKPVSEFSSIDFTVSYRQLVGYQKKSVTAEVQYYPSQTHVLMQTKELASLHYLDASLNWQLRTKEDSPWSVGAGFRFSRLIDWKGQEQQTVWAAYAIGFFDEFREDNGYISYAIRESESSELAQENFRRQDYGIQLYLSYELLPGLKLKTGFYQGFNNVFKKKLFSDGSKYRLTTLSAGLTVRLF